jgi:hypothetical protein
VEVMTCVDHASTESYMLQSGLSGVESSGKRIKVGLLRWSPCSPFSVAVQDGKIPPEPDPRERLKWTQQFGSRLCVPLPQKHWARYGDTGHV